VRQWAMSPESAAGPSRVWGTQGVLATAPIRSAYAAIHLLCDRAPVVRCRWSDHRLRTTGMMSLNVLAMNISVARGTSSVSTGNSRTGQVELDRELQHDVARGAGRMWVVSGCVRSSPLSTRKVALDAPSMITPSRTKIASSAPASTACLLGHDVRQQVDGLDVEPRPPNIGHVITDAPRVRSACGSATR